MNNALNSLTTVQSAVLQPAMSLKAKLEVPEVTEDEEQDLLEEFEELDLYDAEADGIVHEMTDWVKYELDN